VISQHRGNPKIENLVGLMIRGAVAKYFQDPGTALAAYRAAKAVESKRGRELAQQVLDDPTSTEEEKQWAKEVLGSGIKS
jgi:hypothetical protein